MMNIALHPIGILILSGISLTSLSLSANEYYQRDLGLYLGTRVGIVGFDVNQQHNSDNIVSIYGGYQIKPWLAVEGSYAQTKKTHQKRLV
jgi:hypothetical protein